MACEWELYHAQNAARWLGQVWDAELDTPWIYKLIRHRMLTWFKKEAKQFDEAYKAIAAVTKRDLESPYRAAYAQPSVPPSFIAFPLTNEWRQASFDDNDKAPGVTPFKDAGKLQNLRFDPERRAAVWPVISVGCRSITKARLTSSFSRRRDPPIASHLASCPTDRLWRCFRR